MFGKLVIIVCGCLIWETGVKTNIGINLHPHNQVTCHPHVLYPRWQNNTWDIHIRNFQQQSPSVTSHFTEPEQMAACIKLESAASGSWTRAAGVRGECVTTRSPVHIMRYAWCNANSLVPQLGNYNRAVEVLGCNRGKSKCWNCCWDRTDRNFREVEEDN